MDARLYVDGLIRTSATHGQMAKGINENTNILVRGT